MSQSRSLIQSSRAVVEGEAHVEITSSTTQSNTSPKLSITTHGPPQTQTPPGQPSRPLLQFPTNAEHVRSSLVRTISAPYMLQRFLTIEHKNEPLQFEANIGILEGKLHEGKDMLCNKMNEEGWEEIDGDLEFEDSSQECRVWSEGEESGEEPGEDPGEESGEESSLRRSIERVSDGSFTDALSVHLEPWFNNSYIEDQPNSEVEKEGRYETIKCAGTLENLGY